MKVNIKRDIFKELDTLITEHKDTIHNIELSCEELNMYQRQDEVIKGTRGVGGNQYVTAGAVNRYKIYSSLIEAMRNGYVLGYKGVRIIEGKE